MIIPTSATMNSSKESKIETKRIPSQFNQNLCWICHQADRNDQSHEEEDNYLSFALPDKNTFLDQFNLTKKTQEEVFKPCLCKGSLENVHKECLNLWVLKKYQSYLRNFSEKEEEMLFAMGNHNKNELKIKCPNCKFPLKYTVFEKTVFRTSHFFKLDTKEKLTLFLLLLLQMLFLFFDLRSLYKDSLTEDSSWSFTENISHILYLGTMLIILSAGAFNLLDLIGKEVVLEVMNKD